MFVLQGLCDLGQRQSGGLQADRVDDDMVFRGAAADEVDAGDAGDLEEPRLELVAGRLPQVDQAAFGARQADADDGEIGEGHPVDLGLGGRRQRGPDLGQPAEDVELGLDHVDFPIEEDIDLGRAAAGGRADGANAGDVLHALFDRPGDDGHHLVGRHDPVVDEDDDAGKIRLGEDGRGDGQGRVDSRQAEGQADEDDGPGVAGGEPGQRGILAHEAYLSPMMWIFVSPAML